MPRRKKTAMEIEDEVTDRENAIEIQDDDDEDEETFSSDEEFDDDPIVKTFDVFVSDQLKEHIYLLQYPIRNPEEPYSDEYKPSEARIKPQEGLLEVDVPIDKMNYSLLRGQKFAGGQTDVKLEARDIDKQRLSGKTQINQANYFVGIMRGGQMHLSPVKASVQLRPNFHYFDMTVGGEKRKKGQTEEAPARQPRAIQQQVMSSEDPRDPKAQQAPTYEEFIPLTWVDSSSAETLMISDQLFSKDTSKEFVSSISGPEFISRLLFKDGVEESNPVKVE